MHQGWSRVSLRKRQRLIGCTFRNFRPGLNNDWGLVWCLRLVEVNKHKTGLSSFTRCSSSIIGDMTWLWYACMTASIYGYYIVPHDAIHHVLTKHQYDGIDFDWTSTRIPESKTILMCPSIVYCKCILALEFLYVLYSYTHIMIMMIMMMVIHGHTVCASHR